ncbi:MAG: GntR family transcriptional regulator [Acetobacteraceae bacterium]|nr:GntR family transcriptional regulator [Acetobacteraceae bacterium]
MSKREIPDTRPRYRQVADDLIAQLRAGQHPVGAMLPTETELCAHYAVSRHTVREALRLIEEAGLVSRRQGSGTTVIAQEARGRFVQDISSMTELLQYPEETRLTVLRAKEAKLEGMAAAAAGVTAGESWLRVEGIRRVRVTDAPICFVTLLIRPEYASVLDQVGVEPGPVYGLIEKRFGLAVSAVELDMSACGVPEAQAPLLEVETGAPALLIRRRYMDGQGRVFEVSEATHPAPRFTYRATLKREAG